jgi:hypothetical protein
MNAVMLFLAALGCGVLFALIGGPICGVIGFIVAICGGFDS